MDNNLRYLQLLAKDYPNTMAVFKEIINLKAILALPKGTEYFISDLHGEHEAFIHMVRSASGVIHAKIEELLRQSALRGGKRQPCSTYIQSAGGNCTQEEVGRGYECIL